MRLEEDEDREAEEEYWIIKILGVRVRLFEDTGNCGFQFRVQWFADDGSKFPNDWIDEDSMSGERGSLLLAYMTRNKVKMGNLVLQFCHEHEGACPFSSAYSEMVEGVLVVHSPEFTRSESDDDSDGVERVPFRTRVPVHTCAVKSLEGVCADVQFCVAGISMLTRVKAAQLFGYVDDCNLIMSSGQLLADQDEHGHFTVPVDVLNTNAHFAICGTMSDPASVHVDEDPIPLNRIWPSPIFPEDEDLMPTHLHASVFLWLTTGQVTEAYWNTRKDFKKNARRRFKVVEDEHGTIQLYYDATSRIRKSLPNRLAVQMQRYRIVPCMSEAWRIIEADHRKYHDGHNRAEFRLSQDYVIPKLRMYLKFARQQCDDVCGMFARMPKGCVAPIITTRPWQLLMFDLFFLPCKDRNGVHICILMCDHFTKYKWGVALPSKEASGVVAFLVNVFTAEGNAERWHADNGGEFVNALMTQAALDLNVAKMTHGKPRHPQTQGLIERANGVVKKKILKRGLQLGHDNCETDFDWGEVLVEELGIENSSPLTLYGGLTAFFCLRHRPADLRDMELPAPELLAEMHTFMHDRQQKQAAGMVLKGNPIRYSIGDIVRVHKTGTRAKLGNDFHPWKTKAEIIDINTHHMFYYKLRWITKGTRNEKPNTKSKHYYPWSALRLILSGVAADGPNNEDAEPPESKEQGGAEGDEAPDDNEADVMSGLELSSDEDRPLLDKQLKSRGQCHLSVGIVLTSIIR
jgi:hypothetical protein